MKKPHLGIATLFLALAIFAAPLISLAQEGCNAAGEVLTNDRVITMTKAGLSSSIVVGKIRASIIGTMV